MSVSFCLTSHSNASSTDKLEVVAVAATEAMSGLNNKDFSQRLSWLLPTTSTSPASSRNQPSVTKTATFPRRIRQPLGESFPWRRIHTHTHTHTHTYVCTQVIYFSSLHLFLSFSVRTGHSG